MEQSYYQNLSEEGTKVKDTNNDYKENEENPNCLNEIRNDTISGCSSITTDETSPTLFIESKNYHFSDESVAIKYFEALSTLIKDDYSYSVCVEGPNKSLFAKLVLRGLDKHYQCQILQLFNDYPYLQLQLENLFSKIADLCIYIVTVDKLKDGESLLNQVRDKLSELGFFTPNSFDQYSWEERINSIMLDSKDKRIVLYFDDVLTNKNIGRNTVEFRMLTGMSNRIKILSTYQRDPYFDIPIIQPLELIFNHSSDFLRIYVE